MKIGIVSREYPPLTHVGGIATYSAAAARLLAQNGHEVHVVCHCPGGQGPAGQRPGAEVSREAGVTVHRIPMLEHHLPPGRIFYPYRAWYRRNLPHYLDALTWARTVAAFLPRLDAEGFDAWEYPETCGEGAFFPRASGTERPRLVCRVHTGWLEAYAGHFLERRLMIALQRKACLRSDTLVSPSAYMAGDYVRKTLRVGRDVTVSRNPMVLWDEPIDWNSKRARNLLFVGRVEHRKGLQVLLQALDAMGPEAAGFTLRVVGHMHPPTRASDARCQADFQARLAQPVPRAPGYRLEYAGPCDHSQMHRHYDWAGVLVLPSLIENYPYTALEGLSRGCFLLGSDVGGLPEIIDRPARGRLFPAENSAILAEKIRECKLREGEIPESMREVAASVRAEFAPGPCAQRLLETYGTKSVERDRE